MPLEGAEVLEGLLPLLAAFYETRDLAQLHRRRLALEVFVEDRLLLLQAVRQIAYLVLREVALFVFEVYASAALVVSDEDIFEFGLRSEMRVSMPCTLSS